MAGNPNRHIHILVIDDDKQVADMLVSFLTQEGYQAVAAYTGDTGITQFNQSSFHLVILDLKLPDTDGLDVLESIKTIDSNAIVLIISGHGTIEAAVSAVKKGAYDFIPKPVKLDLLELVMRRALEKRSLYKQLGLFRGLALALIISVPIWLLLGIALAKLLA